VGHLPLPIAQISPKRRAIRRWLFSGFVPTNAQGLRMLLGAFRGGNPFGRVVGKPPTESGRHAVSHKKGLGVSRPSGAKQRSADASRLPSINPVMAVPNYFRIVNDPGIVAWCWNRRAVRLLGVDVLHSHEAYFWRESSAARVAPCRAPRRPGALTSAALNSLSARPAWFCSSSKSPSCSRARPGR